MIATDLQYRVTEDRIRRFGQTLVELQGRSGDWLHHAQIHAIRDEIDTLGEALASYDLLASGEIEEIVVERMADLPRDLVRARIVSQMSQRELARASGQSPEHIQRWERDGFSRVPLQTMLRVARVLPMRLPAEIGVADQDVALRDAKRALLAAGMPRQVVDRVIMPNACQGYALADEVNQRLSRLFGAGIVAFAAGRNFEAPMLRFKLPANAEQGRTRAYAAYIDGMCSVVARTQRQPTADLPTGWREVRRLLFPRNVVDLRTAVRSCWSLGVGVLGLRDTVAFHGACRRVDGRATIVLKQSAGQESRWLFDLVHELFHLIAEPSDFTLIEAPETAPERRESQIERRANRFASLVLTDGKLEEAFGDVARRAGGAIQRLSGVVRDVARVHDLPVGIFANLVAQQVQETSGRKWWGGAKNLQPEGDEPWKVVRDVLYEEADLDALDETERALLKQVLETGDE